MALSASEKDQIKQLYLSGLGITAVAREMGLTYDQVRHFVRKSSWYSPQIGERPRTELLTKGVAGVEEGTVLSTGYDSGGNYVQEKILKLKEIEQATPEELLELHGLDPVRWTIKSATNNFYEMQKKGGDVLPIYQSKIIAAPTQDRWAAILKHIEEKTTPYTVKKIEKEHGERYLVVGINDTHFGDNSAEDYADSQQRILRLLTRGWTKIIVYLGGDIFEANSTASETVSGTRVSDYDADDAWDQAERYIEPIIQTAIKHSQQRPELISVNGNHSESYEYGFAKTMKAEWPGIDVDCNSKEWLKARMLGTNLIGFTHGYKNQQNLSINLAKDFSDLWGKSTHQECIAAHKHIESVDKGVMIRVLPTRADDSSRYVRMNNFVRNHKAFMCLEYSQDDIRAVHYV